MKKGCFLQGKNFLRKKNILNPSKLPILTSRLFSVRNHSLGNLIQHEWMNHQLNNWFLLIPKPKFGCDTCHCYHQIDHLVGWIKRNQKDSIRIIFLSDFWVPIALIHFFDSGIKKNQIFEWAVFTQLKTAYSEVMIGYILDLEVTVARACSARGIATGVSWTPLGSFMGRQRQEGLHKTWPSEAALI